MKRSETFGINMKKWCREHEAYITSVISSGPEVSAEASSAADSTAHAASSGECKRELLEYHLTKIQMLQHERLVHLIVTLLVSIVELFVISLVILHPELGIWPAVAMLGFAVLLIFYFAHYFFLENTVQRWYVITDYMRQHLKS